MYQHSRNEGQKHYGFILIDLLCLQLSFIIAYWIRFKSIKLPYSVSYYSTLAVILSLVLVGATFILNTYSRILRRNTLAEAISVALLSFADLGITSMYIVAVHSANIYSRLLIYYTFLIFFVLDLIVRTGAKKIILKRNPFAARKSRSLLIFTEEQFASDIISDIQNDPLNTYDVRGLVFSGESSVDSVSGIPVVAELENAADYICREWVDEVLLYYPDNSRAPENIINECAEMGVTVHTVFNLKNVDRNKQFIEDIGNHTVLTTAFNYIAPYQAVIKRCADIIGGIVGSIAAILISIVIGPLIYISSPGPILFKQVRIGRNGKTFKILKFRSMYLDAEERKKEYLSENRIGDGLMFKLDFDPRIIGNKILTDGTRKTGIGEFIRKTSLDEFPQFFNVLAGDMSLVGTRPPTVDEWEKYQYHHRARLAIKPGITGLWQVSGRSEITDFEEVVRLDTEYICNFRLSLDIKILAKTIVVLFKRKGAL